MHHIWHIRSYNSMLTPPTHQAWWASPSSCMIFEDPYLNGRNLNYCVTEFGCCLPPPATTGIHTVASPRFYHRQSRKRRPSVPERHSQRVPVCEHLLLVPLRIVFDDQRLAALDVFFVVSHLQSVSDRLILSFFGLEEGRTFMVVLEEIMPPTNMDIGIVRSE